MIYIRTDANEIVATGHVMRCLTIADELRRRSLDVRFVVSDEESTKLIVEAGYDCCVLNTDWRHLSTNDELSKMRDLLKKQRERPVLLVDSYYVDNHYFCELGKYAQTVVIDDLFEEVYCADIVINYSICHTLFPYHEAYCGRKTELLLGPGYMPLREQFQNVVYRRLELSDGITKVMLICGGGDMYNILADILQYGIKNQLLDAYEWHVVAGKYNPNIGQLKEIQREKSNVFLHENVTNMAELMTGMDIVVSAASTVLYECCAIGVPTVFFCMAGNQEYDTVCFSREGWMLYAGDIRLERIPVIKAIFKQLTYLRTNPAARAEIHRRLTTIVDGQGAKRIVDEIGVG